MKKKTPKESGGRALKLIKNDKPNIVVPKALEPSSSLAKEMNSFCNELQKQIDLLMRS